MILAGKWSIGSEPTRTLKTSGERPRRMQSCASASDSRGMRRSCKSRDSGMGIAPEVLPRIFDLFVQERQAIDPLQGGLGLGLTIVRNLVERHGGTVSANSDGPGKGSEFVVRLPLVTVGSMLDEAPVNEATPVSVVSRPGLTRRRSSSSMTVVTAQRCWPPRSPPRVMTRA